MQTAPSNLDPIDPRADKPSLAAATSAGSVDDRISNRVPIERQVELRFEDFDGFITECSMNISATGMFIRCDNPQPAGSALDFKFALADGEKLIRGYGEVVWARRTDDGPERPAGMGIRFLHLDAESRELIRWTVTRRYITGAGPCDVAEVKSAMRHAAEREAADRSEHPFHGAPNATAGAEPSQPIRRVSPRARYREAGFAAAANAPQAAKPLHLVAALVALILAGLYILPVISPTVGAATSAAIDDTELETPTTEQVASGPAVPRVIMPSPVVAVDVGAQLSSPEITGDGPPSARLSPEEVASAWSRAWSEQRVADYLSFYAAAFRPAGGLPLSRWQEQRRMRILRPKQIQVDLTAMVVEVVSPERAYVTFKQSYRSENYHDVVRKTLVLVRGDDRWRILEENSTPD